MFVRVVSSAQPLPLKQAIHHRGTRLSRCRARLPAIPLGEEAKPAAYHHVLPVAPGAFAAAWREDERPG